MKRMTLKQRMAQILNVLGKKNGADVYDICATLNIAPGSVNHYLRILERKGLVEYDEEKSVWKIKSAKGTEPEQIEGSGGDGEAV